MEVSCNLQTDETQSFQDHNELNSTKISSLRRRKDGPIRSIFHTKAPETVLQARAG